ncbi:MAG TPA: FAD-binding oxidoreductase [Acidimicrobiales bacterium]|nr:FAD-binding oxidoreductase [Acidimicrobiales bacterium]
MDRRLDRRQFLRRTGAAGAALGSAAILGPLAAGCGGAPTTPATTTTGASTTSTPPTTGTTPVSPADWSALGASLSGTLVLPSSPTYGVDKEDYNERFDGIDPQAIAYCQSPADVQHCVEFVRRHDLAVAARSGGHSYAGYSLCTGLVTDVTRMATVTVADDKATAVVGAGARLIDVYNTLGQAGVVLPGGSCPTVGIAGLTLGGGVGVFGRNFGLTCDNLQALDVVTADGRLVTASASANEDLFWACRGGGGGNFGVVTSFTFRVHPVPPIALFTLEWPWAAAATVLGSWQQWLPTTPAALWSNCQLLSEGSTGPAVKVTGVFCGTTSALSGLLQPLRGSVGTVPTYDFVGPESYLNAMLIEAGCEGSTVAQCHLPSQDPTGNLSRAAFDAKSAYVTTALPAAGIAVVTQAVESLSQQLPQVGGGFVLDSYGGVINQVAAADTAFVHRDALAGVQYSVTWPTGSPSSVPSTAASWLAGAQTALAPYVSGAYQNYIDPTQPDWLTAYYGSNLSRLVQVKQAVDPDDVFHFAQSIPTHLSGA